jgi:DNA-directed RNA polymerase
MLDNSVNHSDELPHSERPNGYKNMNTAEMEATLDACLHVQRWSRAFTLLSQLSVLYQNNQPRLLDIHNRVLGAMAEDLLRNQNHEHASRINDWVEVDMRKAGVEPDARTFALKIKVALDSLLGSKRDRTVRRYWQMTKEYELESEVFSLRDILNDRDLGKLSQICPLEVKALQEESVIDTDLHASATESKKDQKSELEIVQTAQKGLGLATLKKTMRAFSEQEAVESEVDLPEDPMYVRQRRLERDALEIALQRWNIEYKKRAAMGAIDLSHGARGGLLWIWHESLASKITKELELVKEAESITGRKSAQQKLRLEYGSLLGCIPAEKIAATSLIAVMNIFSRSGVAKPIKLARLVTQLGQAIEDEYHAETVAKNTESLMKTFKDTPKGVKMQWREDGASAKLHKRSGHHSARGYKYGRNWTNIQHAKLGAIICELMFDATKLEISKEDTATQKYVSIAQPVFSRTTVWQNGRRIGVVSMLEDFSKILISQPAEHIIVKQLPMVCAPKPWTGFYEGGFLESKQPFLRVKGHELAQKQYAEAAADRGDLDQLFAGIDVLSRTGWRINKQVFNVMVEAWNSGKELANLPPLDKDFPKIETPGPNATPKERWQWFNQMRRVENERSGLHSERCFQNLQMEIAKAYLDETFYLPHNIDFRGRAYPIPPYLNQMGADNCRGLLLFDKGRELGSDGLRWLKIHLSNVYGYDKASLADRAQFPIDNLDKIYDSVRRPLDGERWWLKAEDPWQCLATCFELTNALDLPDPTKFVSRLPVHQDGSCNGLQHYAALGGDVAGAKQVNLEPGDMPSDVYSGVCELVKAAIKEDTAQGHPIAKLLEGRVTRKVVKQTVMTNVYGVTFLGAIRQVRKQLETLMPDLAKDQVSGKAATYIAKNIFRGLGTLFTGAHEIQYWLGDCANRISSSISPAQMEKMHSQAYGTADFVPEAISIDRRKACKKEQKESYESGVFRTSVIWTTPLKLPVVQPYRVNKTQSIQTNLQHISLAQPSVADAVNKRKQLQAFPPNFVHSLDACHMALSALKADELGLSFSAVHDSFWTHASDVNTLNTLLREAFIRMHSEDIIGRLSAEFQKRYEGHYYVARIGKSNKLAKAINAYRKRMVTEGLLPPGSGSKGIQERRHAELLREVRKIKLMASEDAKEREEGEKMVTAATLFKELDGEKYIFSRNSLGETAIGSIPDNVDESVLEQAMHSEDAIGDANLARTLDPLKDSIAEVDEEEDAGETDTHASTESCLPTEDLLSDLHRRNAFGDKLPNKRPAKPSLNNQIWLWLPLKFKPVPKKGDFDVTRLRDSTYFFS